MPKNYDGKYRGPIALRDALAQSINIPAVKVLYLAGLENVLKNAYAFGLTTLTDPARYGLSLVLGGGEVRLIDLVQAYSVLSQEGVLHSQSYILEIKDGTNRQLEFYKDSIKEVMVPQYPRLINDILSDVSARAGLLHSSLNLTIFPSYDVAMKTGTSNDYHDAWAVGYTPFLVAGVWAGNNDNAPMQKSGSSILAAIPTWNAFMKEALKEFAPETFNRPDPVIVEKPILRGQYIIDSQIHSILYYLDKDNPNGPPPSDPTNDSQFENWESGIQGWFRTNFPTGSFLFGSSTATTSSSTP
jgi:membrane peptidoglycan carboxypeptidase